MSIQNVGRNRWRVIVKKGIDPSTSQTKYLDRIIRGSRQDAVDFEAKEAGTGGVITPKTTLAEFMRRSWLPSLSVDPGTVYEYTRGTEYVIPTIGAVPLSRLSVRDVEYAIHSLPEGSRRARAKKVLSMALNAAVRWKMLPPNPVRDANINIGNGQTREYEAYDAQEIAELLVAFNGHKAEPVVIVMVFCGLRKEEALALDWEDINVDTGVIEIRRAWVISGSTIMIKEPKTEKSARAVYIDGWGLERLRELRANQTGALWKGKKHERVRPDAARRTFKRQVESSGLRYIPLIALRHSHATCALASGVDIAVLSRELGHTKISTTARYLRPLEKARVQAAGMFAQIIGEELNSANSRKTPENYGKQGNKREHFRKNGEK